MQHTHEALFAAIPDVKMATVRIAQRGSVSVMEWVTKGTHKGKWLGIGATNKPMGFRAATVMRFDSEGQVSEDHTYFDVLSVPLELGRGNGKTRPVPTLPADPMAIVAPSLSSGNAGEDTNATLVRALYAAQDKKSETEWTAALTDAVVRADQREAADTKGKDAVLGEVRRLGKDHAALTTRIRDVWAVGDIVVAEVTLDDPPGASTHRLDIYETTAGKITKLWTYGVRTGAKP